MTREKITLKKGAVPVHKMPVAQPAPAPTPVAATPAGEDLAQLRLDAARYRWLRQDDTVVDWVQAGVVQEYYGYEGRISGEQLDAVIDKAMGAKK